MSVCSLVYLSVSVSLYALRLLHAPVEARVGCQILWSQL